MSHIAIRRSHLKEPIEQWLIGSQKDQGGEINMATTKSEQEQPHKIIYYTLIKIFFLYSISIGTNKINTYVIAPATEALMGEKLGTNIV